MTVNPKWGMWLSIGLALISYLAGAGTLLTTIFGDHATVIILAVLTLVLGAGNTVNAVLHMIPSPSGQVGANEFLLGPKTAVPPAAKVAAFFAILVLGTLMMAGTGYAQTRKLPVPHITGNLPADIAADAKDVAGTTTATASNAVSILNQLRAKFTADLNADLTSALALAQQVPAGCTATPPTTTSCAPADSTAVPCYQAILSLNGVVNSYTPPTDKPHVISDLEQLRIVARTIQSSNFKDACAPLVQDINNQATQLVASVLGIVSGAAKIGIAIP